MRQADAKRRICAKFERWCVPWCKDDPGKDRPTGNDARFLFYIPELEA